MQRYIPYPHISKKEIICFLYTTAVLCICFAPWLFHFIWGNHDWLPLIADSHLGVGLIEGRFTQYILLNIFLMGKILPLLNIILGFICYATALILLWKYFFQFSPPSYIAVLFTITIASLPYISEILYFHFIILSQLSWPLIIVLALLAAQKAAAAHFTFFTTLSTILLFTALGGYPASAGLFATAACLYAFKLAENPLKINSFCRALTPFALSMLLSFLGLVIVQKWLLENGLMIRLYNNQNITFSEILSNILPTITAAAQSMIQSQPFFTLTFKLLTTGIIVSFIIKYFTTLQSLNKLLRLPLIIILLLAIKFSALLASKSGNNYFAQYDPIEFMVRTDFYTMPCLIMFSLFYLYQKTATSQRNLLYIVSIALLWGNVNSCLTFSKVNTLGFNAENLLLNRIIAQIHNTPEYNTSQFYNIIQAGELPLRQKYYQPAPYEKYGYYTLQVPFTRYWIPNEYYNFYTPKPFIASQTPIDPRNLSTRAFAYLDTTITPWPSPYAVLIDGNNIILSLTQDGQDVLLQQFNNIQKQMP